MATVTLTVKDSLWKEFTALAGRRRRVAARWAESLLAEAVQQLADDDLMARTERAFRRSKLSIREIEERIRQNRREKARKAADGRQKKASAGGS